MKKLAICMVGLIGLARLEAAPPNILVIMGDDWSWPHAGAYGGPVVKTPTFDRIAREGVRFDHAFVSAPSCTPSRFAVATGQWPWRLGDGANLWGSLPKEVQVYPEMLQAAGYTIGYMQKGGKPSRHVHRNRDPFGERFKDFDAFMDARKPNEPFCFWFGSGDPHRPYEKGTGVKSGMDPSKVVIPPGLPDHPVVRRDLCDYYFEIQRMDRRAGAMLDRLAKQGELDRTIVVMTGDNGLPFPRCKATLYDMGTRVPLAIRWGDQVKAGRTVNDMVSLCDLAPTFLKAARLEPDARMTGRSLLPILISGKSGRVEADRDVTFSGRDQHVYEYPMRAIRTRDFLYIRNIQPRNWKTGEGEWKEPAKDHSFAIDPGPTKTLIYENREEPRFKPFYDLAFGPFKDVELYDLRKDPGQVNNVAANPKYAEVMRKLHARLVTEMKVTGDPRANQL